VKSFDPATMWNAPRVRPGGHDQTKPFFAREKYQTGDRRSLGDEWRNGYRVVTFCA